VKIVFVGHVDHGKSTLIGRILEETGSLTEGKIEAMRASCEAQGQRFEYAFLLDALAEEPQQNVTIDTCIKRRAPEGQKALPESMHPMRRRRIRRLPFERTNRPQGNAWTRFWGSSFHVYVCHKSGQLQRVVRPVDTRPRLASSGPTAPAHAGRHRDGFANNVSDRRKERVDNQVANPLSGNA
jgi:hypothetical protein